jgi:hypothetical protein
MLEFLQYGVGSRYCTLAQRKIRKMATATEKNKEYFKRCARAILPKQILL